MSEKTIKDSFIFIIIDNFISIITFSLMLPLLLYFILLKFIEYLNERKLKNREFKKKKKDLMYYCNKCTFKTKNFVDWIFHNCYEECAINE